MHRAAPTPVAGHTSSASSLRRLVRQSAAKRGLRQGEVVFTGEQRDSAVHVTAFVYDEDGIEEHESVSPEDACALLGQPGVTWLNVDGVHDTALIERLGETVGLHRLVQEDIASTVQRAKAEDFDGYLYVVIPMLRHDEKRVTTVVEQVSLVLGDGWLISFLEDPGDVFDPIRVRLRQGSLLRKRRADALLAALLDAAVDSYFATFEALGDLAADVEEHAMSRRPPADVQGGLNALRRELIGLRRVIWPVREALAQVERSDNPLIDDTTRPYVRDAYDHAVQAIDIVESLRDVLSGVMDLYMTTLSNRMNEVMKVLTVVSTVFIPITFLSSVYGMNFEYMPELHHRYAYPALLLVMALTVAGMLVYFRRKGWI